MLKVVGGVYHEHCMHPPWDEIYGSAGRAAAAIAQMGHKAELYSYLDKLSIATLATRAVFDENFTFDSAHIVDEGIHFNYWHGLATPKIHRPKVLPSKPLNIEGENIIRFGMIEEEAVVKGDYVVYDPQNVGKPVAFHDNGSVANHLALVLNGYEATSLSGMLNATPMEMASTLATRYKAEVIIIKMGPQGALVYYEGEISEVPAFRTEKVWKIGSGDTFVAHFGLNWMVQKMSPRDAAILASKATAYYCSTQGFPTQNQLEKFQTQEIKLSERVRNGEKPVIYLAGPFFTLAQRWMIEQARDNLRAMGLMVFSPFHDVGLGGAESVVQRDLEGIRDCDTVFAIVDGLDAGTVYEIGYARALDKQVVIYCENESKQDLKMMVGSDCVISDDFVSSIYQTLWMANNV